MNAGTSPQQKLPTYGEKPARPGLYLGLLHGRDHPQQQMNDWGFNGPMIGPLRWFHTTYACTIRIVRIPLMADSDSIPIADSVPGDGGHDARVS